MSEIRETLLETILLSGTIELSSEQKSLLIDNKMEDYVQNYVNQHTYFSIKGTAYDYLQFVLGINIGRRDFVLMKLKKALCYKFKTYFKRLTERDIIKKYNRNTYMKR